MDCRRCQDLLDNLLVAEPTPAQRAALVQHAEACPECARQYDSANQALAAITPMSPLRISADFKERVMHAISDARLFQPEPITMRVSRVRAWKVMAAVAAAAVLLVAVTPFFRLGPGPAGNGTGGRFSAFSLLSEACAAETTLFAGNQIVHLVNEIIVMPVSDPTLARMRWFPLVSLDATGKPHYQQLTLAAEPGKGYTVEDQSWYDPATGRYVRVMTSAGKPIFATSFDGSKVYDLEMPATGAPRVVNRAIGKDFRPPKSPAEFLGISTGLQSAVDRKDETLVQDAGKTKLEDGSEAHLLNLGMPTKGGPKEAGDAYYLVTIRVDNNRIEKMEFTINGQTMFVIRRGKSEPGQGPTSGWNLAGIAQKAAGLAATPGLGIVANMVIPNVSVEHMVKKADFATYVFAKDPSWAGDCTITDVLDIPNPLHRMFAITYRAKDGRHVVLLQSYTYNQMLGPLAKTGKLVYTSTDGVKVWSGPRDQWLAQILLQSARAAIQDPPGKELTGYLLETPLGTFPALAINGRLTEEELHALIDSLVPAKKPAKD
jgi:hypothetical protein